MTHPTTDHEQQAHNTPAGSATGDVFKVGGLLVFLFLCSLAANYLFAREMLYDWTQNRDNARAVQSIQPDAGGVTR